MSRGRGNYNNYQGGRGGYANVNHNRNFNQQNINQYVNANSIPIEISGWNGASMEDCIHFISRKCRIVVSNASIEPNGNIKGYVKSEKDANDLLNWNGVKFAGQSLKMFKSYQTTGTNGATGFGNNASNMNVNGKGNTIEIITEFLKSRYQAESKMLNLSNVQHDQNLINQGFFATISTTSKFFPALMKVASELKIDVESVDLSNNNLNDLTTVSTLPQTFPKLINLSLMNNSIQRLKVFEIWKHKLNYLRELIIGGNPFLNASDANTIKLEISKLFPRLIILNGEILRNEAVLLENLKFPFIKYQPMFFQDNDIQNMSTNFITNFFNLWDSNRTNLLQLYQNESQFSLSVDMSNPHDLNAGQVDFSYYLPFSRNLTRISASKLKMNKLSIGKDQILNQFQQLPKSKHDLIAKPQDFTMESFRFNQLNGIIINLHGTFHELGAPEISSNQGNQAPGGPKKYHGGNNRSKRIALSDKGFDRCFVVVPGPDGSMIVASDSLIIRYPTKFNPEVANASLNPTPGSTVPATVGSNVIPPATAHTSPAPGQPTIPPQTPQPPGPGQPAIGQPGAPTINDLPPDIKSMINTIQQELLVKVLLETNLNLQFGYMLCEQSNWDYQQCIVNFKNSVNSLPPDAYR